MQNKSTITNLRFNHNPVLPAAVMESLGSLPISFFEDGLIIDATLGGGGHSFQMLKKYPHLRLIGLDQDPAARHTAANKLLEFGKRVKIISENFSIFEPDEKAVFILADLGVSSHQLDSAERGFSFSRNGPLDMRMNPSQEMKACDLIENLNEQELADIIFKYGEERLSRRIARKIKKDLLEKGSYTGTVDLAYSIAGCYPRKIRYKGIHPATRTFQAIRIAVNKELEVLDTFLQKAPEWLHQNGLINIISFHSLEDRLVKTAFLNDNRLKRLTKKPITPSIEEINENQRSRSAKYRVAMRY